MSAPTCRKGASDSWPFAMDLAPQAAVEAVDLSLALQQLDGTIGPRDEFDSIVPALRPRSIRNAEQARPIGSVRKRTPGAS